MKHTFAALLVALCLFSLTSCALSPAPAASSSGTSSGSSSSGADSSSGSSAQPAPSIPTDEERAESLVSSLTPEEKVGQLFFARCPQQDAVKDVGAYQLGGYLLFGRDFDQKTADAVIQTIASYQQAAKIPLLIGTDEEGGTVVRVSSDPHLRASKFSSPQKLYQKGGMDAILADTAEKDRLLHALGINVNLAPVSDVSTDSGDFIYARSFGKDAAATADYIGAVVTQMNEDGMGSVLKHFPGYGNNVDTHTGIAVDERPLETFLSSDFLPFQAGIDAGSGAVLVSHNIMTSVDHTLPASLSPAVHQLLRDKLGFNGVVMTDDLAMDAVAQYAKDGSAAVLAVLAGNDLLISSDYQTQIPQVLAALQDGTIDETIIDAAVTHVLLWKIQLGLL